MSYDISLIINTGIKDIEVVELGNYTYNCGGMFADATEKDIWLSGLSSLSCEDAEKIISVAVKNMSENPEKYRKMNPKNGWGDYDSFLEYVTDLLEKCRQNPKCKILVT